MVRLPAVEKMSQREIANGLGISKTTVNEVLKRQKAVGAPPSES